MVACDGWHAVCNCHSIASKNYSSVLKKAQTYCHLRHRSHPSRFSPNIPTIQPHYPFQHRSVKWHFDLPSGVQTHLVNVKVIHLGGMVGVQESGLGKWSYKKKEVWNLYNKHPVLTAWVNSSTVLHVYDEIPGFPWSIPRDFREPMTNFMISS